MKCATEMERKTNKLRQQILRKYYVRISMRKEISKISKIESVRRLEELARNEKYALFRYKENIERGGNPAGAEAL